MAWVLQHRAPCLPSSYLRVSLYFKLWCDSFLYPDALQAANHISKMKLFSLPSLLCLPLFGPDNPHTRSPPPPPSNNPSCPPTLHASAVTGIIDSQPPEWHSLLSAVFLELNFTLLPGLGLLLFPCLHFQPLTVHSLWKLYNIRSPFIRITQQPFPHAGCRLQSYLQFLPSTSSSLKWKNNSLFLNV